MTKTKTFKSLLDQFNYVNSHNHRNKKDVDAWYIVLHGNHVDEVRLTSEIVVFG